MVDDCIFRFLRNHYLSLSLVSAGLAVAVAGCGGGGGGGGGGGSAGANNAPSVNAVIESVFEGSDVPVTVNAADPDGSVASVSFSYDDGVDHDVFLTPQGGGDYTGNIPALVSAYYAWKSSATDDDGKTTNVDGLFGVLADEISGDLALEDRLAFYKSDGDILDFWINYTFDLGGFLVQVDAAVLPSIAVGFNGGWHQGPLDDDHSLQKSQMESYGINHWQINSCVKSDISSYLDQIRDGGWQSGLVVGQSSLMAKAASLPSKEYFDPFGLDGEWYCGITLAGCKTDFFDEVEKGILHLVRVYD